MQKIVSLLLLAVVYTCQGSKLLDGIVDSYRRILQEGFKKNMVDVEGMTELMHLFDGSPKYNKGAMDFIAEKLGGTTPVPFSRLKEIVDEIYGDQISDDPFQPQEIHIALTNKTSNMNVMWVTMENLENPHVQYVPAIVKKQSDTINWKLATTNAARNYTYRVEQKWWPIFTGVIYEVDMTGLNANQEYIYRVGGYDPVNATMRYSDEFTFRAQPETNPARKTRVVALADHGTFMIFGFETIKKIVSMMDSLKPDFAFVAGDLSYAGLSSALPPLNISKEDEFEHIWDLLAIQNQPIASQIPWMVGNGNHERFYDWAAYTNRYIMPNNAPQLPSNGGFWYTFAYGNIQWIQLSSEHDLSPTSPQYQFLTAALSQANNNREQVPWIVVSIHKPLYSSIEGAPSFANALESILLQYDVDLTITGHMHAYERIHPVKEGVVTAYPKTLGHALLRKVDIYEDMEGKGPVHVMQGHAGGMQAERFVQPKPDYSAFRMANGIVPPDRSHSSAQDWAKKHHMTLDLSDTSTLDYHAIEELPLISREDRSLSVEYNYSHTYGFGVITAYNATHLHYESVPNVDGVLDHDEFWVVKKHQVLMV